ncbi:unnamed protein product [Arabidopsis lyrata]|nr:unnamed protein product [Arabidopsis lyrata]
MVDYILGVSDPMKQHFEITMLHGWFTLWSNAGILLSIFHIPYSCIVYTA